MKCNEMEEYFADYSDNKLESKLYSDISEHLGRCPICQAEYEKFKILLSEIHNSPIILPDTSLEKNFHKMLNEFKTETIHHKETFFDKIISIVHKILHSKISLPAPAAIGIVIIFVGVIYFQNKQSNKFSEIPKSNIQEVIRPQINFPKSEENKILVLAESNKEPAMLYPVIKIFDY